MPGPQTGPCGGVGQPACKPVDAAKIIDGVSYYSAEQMDSHGQLNYLKGRTDERMLPHPADDGPK